METTLKVHLTHIRMPIINKTGVNKCWSAVGETECQYTVDEIQTGMVNIEITLSVPNISEYFDFIS